MSLCLFLLSFAFVYADLNYIQVILIFLKMIQGFFTCHLNIVLSSVPLWTGRPNTRTFPAILFTLPPSKAADTAHLCVDPQNQALVVNRRVATDIQVCGTHGIEDLVNATITPNAEEVEEVEHSSDNYKLQHRTAMGYFKISPCFSLSLYLHQSQ